MFESFVSWFLSLLYQLWLGGAYIVGIIEDIFLMFVGINPVYSAGAEAGNQEGGFSDITTMIINNRGIREIFNNLIVFAVIMLIFFTILQIIREHYKDKNGGNPYVLVFRMIKAMVLFIFVTAGCILGLQASNVVLRALYRATGGGESGIGGTIFIAMATNANRAAQGIDSDVDKNSKNLYAAVTASKDEKEWVWADGDLPRIWYGGDPDNLYEGGMGCTAPLHFLGSWSHQCAAKENVKEKSTTGEFWEIPSNMSDLTKYFVPAKGETASKVDSIGGDFYIHSQLIRFNITELLHKTSVSHDKTYAAVRRLDQLNTWHIEEDIYERSLNIYTVDDKGKSKKVPRYLNETLFGNYVLALVETAGEHKGFHRLSSSSTNINASASTSYEGWIWGNATYGVRGLESEAGHWSSGTGGTYHYYAITVDQFGRPESSVLRQYGSLQGSYFYLQADSDLSTVTHETLFSYYQRSALGRTSPSPYYTLTRTEKENYANWIDNLMRRRKGATLGSEVPERLMLYNDANFLKSKRETKGPMRYTNVHAVTALYSISDFNWIIGFGGLIIALGVYNSFAFGMIQRIAELGILYVFSPVTLAFFPFDDGAQFNNSFVKPFYKKAIASFAPVISLNLFFAILPAFDSIVWFGGFTGSGVLNAITGCLVTIALLSMLPKVRSSIQTMLGADPMEEKKFFGKGSVMDNARKSIGLTSKNAANLQKFGQASAYWARNRADNKNKRLRAIAEKNAEYGLKGAAGKGLLGRFNRARNDLYNTKSLNTELGAQGKAQSSANRLNQARKNLGDKLFNKNIDKAMDKAIASGDLNAINGDKRMRRRAWEELGKARGHTGAKLAQFVNQRENLKFGKDQFDEARTGFNKARGVQRKGGQLQTRAEALQAEWDARAGITKGSDGKYYNADGTLATNRRTVGVDDVRARAQSDRQKRLNEKQLQEMLGNKQIKNAGWMTSLFDKNGNMLEGAALSDEFNAALFANKDKRKYSATKEGLKGGLLGGLKTAQNIGSTLLNPWKMTDTIQGGLAKMRAKPNMFGTVMDAMFDPDNGLFYQSKLGKMMDGFSYFKTFKSLDSWENGKTERKKIEAYAAARTYRFSNAFADNTQEIVEMKAKELKREAVCGTSAQSAKAGVEAAEAAAKAATQKIADTIIAAGASATGGKNVFDMGITKALGSLKQGDSGYDIRMNEIHNMLNTGDKKGFADMFGSMGATMLKLRDSSVFADKSKYAIIQDERKKIFEYQEIKSMALNEKGEYISQDEYIAGNSKRRSQLNEYMDSGMRILGISESDRAELGRLRAELTDENGTYINVKRAYENGEKPTVKIDGKDIKIDGKEAFDTFQKHMVSSYEKAVQSKVDFHAVAFRDYGEKTGDRTDGIMGATMASEQIKLMQDTIMKTDKTTHQVFRDPAFVDAVKNSSWQTLSDQFMKASRGEENMFDKSILAGVTKPHELEEIGKMFKNMMGSADGEMRGEGYAIANNIIAKTFRMAFVDQITDALKVTSGMLDGMQTQAQRMRDTMQRDLQGLQEAGEGWQKAALSGFSVMKIGEGDMNGVELDKMRKSMLENLERTVKTRKAAGEHISDIDVTNMRDKVLQLFSQEMEDRRLRRETNEMNWRMRELIELDFLARNAGDRKDDKLQYYQSPFGNN